MIEYAILGTSHPVQDSSKIEKPVTDAMRKHAIALVAEEYTCDNPSPVCVTTKHLHVPYLQIDLFPQEWPAHGIDDEMRAAARLPRGHDIRLSHADAVREDFWLETIEAYAGGKRVLVICGYLHVNFLARRAEERGSTVLEKSTFPVELLDREPTMVLSPAELGEYLRVLGGAGP